LVHPIDTSGCGVGLLLDAARADVAPGELGRGRTDLDVDKRTKKGNSTPSGKEHPTVFRTEADRDGGGEILAPRVGGGGGGGVHEMITKGEIPKSS